MFGVHSYKEKKKFLRKTGKSRMLKYISIEKGNYRKKKKRGNFRK